MDDLQGIDVEKIAQQIQAKVRERQPAEPSSTVLTDLSKGQLTADLAALHSHGDPCSVKFTSHRKILGRFIVLAKEGLRRLLTPILEQQLMYNATNARIISQLWEQVQEMQQLQGLLQREIQELGSKVALRGEVENVGQRQDAALRVLREAVLWQLAELEQRHMQICQTLQNGVMEQIKDLGEHLQKRIAHPQKTVIAQECRITANVDEAGRRLPQQ